jgi:hypothetical protein
LLAFGALLLARAAGGLFFGAVVVVVAPLRSCGRHVFVFRDKEINKETKKK